MDILEQFKTGLGFKTKTKRAIVILTVCIHTSVCTHIVYTVHTNDVNAVGNSGVDPFVVLFMTEPSEHTT